MAEVIPSINAHERDFDDVVKKTRAVESFSEWVHLDVADGCFTFNKTWGDPLGWKKVECRAKLEVHLMIEEPERVVEEWCKAGARRVIIHLEALKKQQNKLNPPSGKERLDAIRETCARYHAEVMLAINPETPVDELRSYFNACSGFQILSVHPGLPGQHFLPLSCEKVKQLRSFLPDAIIEVDGGINLETGALVKTTGADILVSASYIFGSSNPKQAYEDLRKIE